MNSWPVLGWSEPPKDEVWKTSPRQKISGLLNVAKAKVESVPYKVSLRWLFYAMWQDGYLRGYGKRSKKKDKSPKLAAYESMKGWASKARHTGIWPLEILADDTRGPIGYYHEDESKWLEWMINRECRLDVWGRMEKYVMLVFEARAMTDQFRYYSEPYDIVLWPCGGDPSIDLKRQLAEHVDWAAQTFGVDVTLLYFGDYEAGGKGEQIGETTMRHVRKWSQYGFTAYRVGLNPEHLSEIEDNPEKPGHYQWEALPDARAGEIIREALDEFADLSILTEVRKVAEAMTEKIRTALQKVAE